MTRRLLGALLTAVTATVLLGVTPASAAAANFAGTVALSNGHPTAGSAIDVVSGYWKRVYSCTIDGFVYRLKEGSWTWKDSIRYTSACQTIGGTSGSPIISGGKVVGVNNTGNEDGERCTENNPCGVAEAG